LEVVAEREVAEHLEEREVPVRVADVLDVAGPKHLLHGGRATIGRLGETKEERLELIHPGVREQQRGVVRDQRGGGHDPMLPLLEEPEERLSDLAAPSPGKGCPTAACPSGTRWPRRRWWRPAPPDRTGRPGPPEAWPSRRRLPRPAASGCPGPGPRCRG